MGRIDRSNGQDATMERRHIQQMLRHIDEYELVKSKQHPKYRFIEEFYRAKGLVRQNFLKYYRRYVNSGRNKEALIPRRAGRKFRDCLGYHPEVVAKIKELREKCYNRYDIADLIERHHGEKMSGSSVYRLLKKLGINRINRRIKPEVTRIIKTKPGELGHIDVHYVNRSTIIEGLPAKQRVYIVGIIDSHSRVVWMEVLTNIKSLNVMFATMEMLNILKSRYGIRYEEIMSDNGSEFTSSSKKDKSNHPFESMLSWLNIKHRYIRPGRPQTNGKIERFWRTLEEEVLEDETFESLDDLKHHIEAYCIYYNEHRKHQGINLKLPQEMLA